MKRILIADDEKEALEILAKRLRQNNYDVNAVGSAKEALVSAKAERPELMLLDIVLPDMDAYELVNNLRKDKLLEGVPILLVTGKELMPQGIEKRMSELGIHGYLNKPCSFDTILAKIKEIVG